MAKQPFSLSLSLSLSLHRSAIPAGAIAQIFTRPRVHVGFNPFIRVQPERVPSIGHPYLECQLLHTELKFSFTGERETDREREKLCSWSDVLKNIKLRSGRFHNFGLFHAFAFSTIFPSNILSVNLFALREFVIVANGKKGLPTLFLYIISVNISKNLFEMLHEQNFTRMIYSNCCTNKISFEQFIRNIIKFYSNNAQLLTNVPA